MSVSIIRLFLKLAMFNLYYFYSNITYDNSVKAQGIETELTLLTCENSGTMRLIYHCIYKEGE